MYADFWFSKNLNKKEFLKKLKEKKKLNQYKTQILILHWWVWCFIYTFNHFKNEFTSTALSDANWSVENGKQSGIFAENANSARARRSWSGHRPWQCGCRPLTIERRETLLTDWSFARRPPHFHARRVPSRWKESSCLWRWNTIVFLSRLIRPA